MPDYANRIRIRHQRMTVTPQDLHDALGAIQIVSNTESGVVVFHGPDGERVCAACGCPKPGHCKVCGCQTDAGLDTECQCATFVPELYACTECGHLFRTKWQMQVHRLPTPSCLRAAVGAAGRFAEPPRFEPPLKAQRDKIRGAR